MSVTMVRQQVRADALEQAQAAARELFAALARVRPDGIRYASTRVADTGTFVILLELADGRADPRQEIPEFGQFLQQLQGFVDGPPVIEQLDVVGSYRLFATPDGVAAVR
ncbi:hypothetical protein CS0771_44180 [Catellatospora sp. IY07-71]|uniref:hypothetical protein n=1 Tax=Catellatospora sp. IY07-71 TaxID=2728827 RepID=UPI001BB384E9|nr:hypothetical protein [Catellatospora sp. IY07-71]BCJ74874.1 hypothetical protein CS0771_44180 [Catellatospora sp. IY07-71]